MASSAPNKNFVARAAAVLTTGEVAGTSLDLNEAFQGVVSCQIDFTLGMLTNCVFKFYVSMDNSTFYPLFGPTGATLTQTYTANTTVAIPLSGGGWKFLRVSATGSGTVTSSTATVTLRYLRRGSQ